MFKNAHGDVLSAYSSTTNKLADYTYYAWGEIQSIGDYTWEKGNLIRYNGQYYDTESGMTYLRARYYDSGIKRFISEDPIKDGLNWYSYAANNPVMFADPRGLYENEIKTLMISILRLVDNKVNYQNYLHDRDFGTSYAGGYYSGPNQDEYYEEKFFDIHGWANIERQKIREDSYLQKNPTLQSVIFEIIDLEGGGSIEEVSVAMYITVYYAEQIDKGNIPSYDDLKFPYNSHVKENTMYLYSFPTLDYNNEMRQKTHYYIGCERVILQLILIHIHMEIEKL